MAVPCAGNRDRQGADKCEILEGAIFRGLIFYCVVRTIVVFSFVALSAHAQSPLVKILSDELERNFTALQKADPAPYFLGYEVTDQEQDVIIATRGSIDGQNHNHDRILDITVRTGTPKFDNYRRTGNDRVRFTLPTRIALDDNADAIRKEVWLTTDRV